MSSRWLLCVQEDDATVVRGRLQGHHPDVQPHQSWLVPEITRVSLLVSRYPGQKKITVMETPLSLSSPNQNVDEPFVSTVTKGQQCERRGVADVLQEGPAGVPGILPGTRTRGVDSANQRARPVRDQVNMMNTGDKSLLWCQLWNYSPVKFSAIL